VKPVSLLHNPTPAAIRKKSRRFVAIRCMLPLGASGVGRGKKQVIVS
jgi:hypothetical protein